MIINHNYYAQKLIQNKDIIKISTIIKNNGEEIRFVGGCIRNIMMNEQNNDLIPEITDVDIATTMNPNHVMKLLKKNNIQAIPTGIKHGTITAVMRKNTYEITTLRRDVECDGRHAVVEFTSKWHDDAARRDFTFNALYMDMDGKIYDYFNGIKHLEVRHLEFINDPEQRVQEDYLRIIRAFRFHAAICYENILSEEILYVCSKYKENIDDISGERIKTEMTKMLRYKYISRSLNHMQECGILERICLGQINLNNLERLEKSCNINLNYIQKLSVILRTHKRSTNYIDILEEIKLRWKLSNKEFKLLSKLTIYDDNPVFSIEEHQRNILELGEDLYYNIIHVYTYEGQISLDNYNLCVKYIKEVEQLKFPLSGKNLIDLGEEPGEELGKLINMLRKSWIKSNGQLSKEDLLKLYRDNKD